LEILTVGWVKRSETQQARKRWVTLRSAASGVYVTQTPGATTAGTSLLYERLRQRVMPPARLPFCCPLRAVGPTQSPGCRETLPRALIHRNALAPQPTKN